jgi:hypothetical protein
MDTVRNETPKPTYQHIIIFYYLLILFYLFYYLFDKELNTMENIQNNNCDHHKHINVSYGYGRFYVFVSLKSGPYR